VALTKTRNRTQTALTSFATLLANVNGELAYIGRRMPEVDGALRSALAARESRLCADRDALFVTIRQFDPKLDPTVVGTAEDWRRPYGRGRPAVRRYELALLGSP
jgi:hypothetical protein